MDSWGFPANLKEIPFTTEDPWTQPSESKTADSTAQRMNETEGRPIINLEEPQSGLGPSHFGDTQQVHRRLQFSQAPSAATWFDEASQPVSEQLPVSHFNSYFAKKKTYHKLRKHMKVDPQPRYLALKTGGKLRYSTVCDPSEKENYLMCGHCSDQRLFKTVQILERHGLECPGKMQELMGSQVFASIQAPQNTPFQPVQVAPQVTGGHVQPNIRSMFSTPSQTITPHSYPLTQASQSFYQHSLPSQPEQTVQGQVVSQPGPLQGRVIFSAAPASQSMRVEPAQTLPQESHSVDPARTLQRESQSIHVNPAQTLAQESHSVDPARTLQRESQSIHVDPAQTLPRESHSVDPARTLQRESQSPRADPAQTLPRESHSVDPARTLPRESQSPRADPAQTLPRESHSVDHSPRLQLLSQDVSHCAENHEESKEPLKQRQRQMQIDKVADSASSQGPRVKITEPAQDGQARTDAQASKKRRRKGKRAPMKKVKNCATGVAILASQSLRYDETPSSSPRAKKRAQSTGSLKNTRPCVLYDTLPYAFAKEYTSWFTEWRKDDHFRMIGCLHTKSAQTAPEEEHTLKSLSSLRDEGSYAPDGTGAEDDLLLPTPCIASQPPDFRYLSAQHKLQSPLFTDGSPSSSRGDFRIHGKQDALCGNPQLPERRNQGLALPAALPMLACQTRDPASRGGPDTKPNGAQERWAKKHVAGVASRRAAQSRNIPNAKGESAVCDSTPSVLREIPHLRRPRDSSQSEPRKAPRLHRPSLSAKENAPPGRHSRMQVARAAAPANANSPPCCSKTGWAKTPSQTSSGWEPGARTFKSHRPPNRLQRSRAASGRNGSPPRTAPRATGVDSRRNRPETIVAEVKLQPTPRCPKDSTAQQRKDPLRICKREGARPTALLSASANRCARGGPSPVRGSPAASPTSHLNRGRPSQPSQCASSTRPANKLQRLRAQTAEAPTQRPLRQNVPNIAGSASPVGIRSTGDRAPGRSQPQGGQSNAQPSVKGPQLLAPERTVGPQKNSHSNVATRDDSASGVDPVRGVSKRPPRGPRAGASAIPGIPEKTRPTFERTRHSGNGITAPGPPDKACRVHKAPLASSSTKPANCVIKKCDKRARTLKSRHAKTPFNDKIAMQSILDRVMLAVKKTPDGSRVQITLPDSRSSKTVARTKSFIEKSRQPRTRTKKLTRG